MSEPFRLPNHGNCLEFPVDFDTKIVQPFPIGRIMCGEHCIRIILTTKGIKLVIPKKAIGNSVLIMADSEGEIEFAGFSSK
jgi:hypothetical protein